MRWWLAAIAFLVAVIGVGVIVGYHVTSVEFPFRPPVRGGPVWDEIRRLTSTPVPNLA